MDLDAGAVDSNVFSGKTVVIHCAGGHHSAAKHREL
jgi:hypothetical protein